MEIPNIFGKNSIIDVKVNVKFTVRHCELWTKNEDISEAPVQI